VPALRRGFCFYSDALAFKGGTTRVVPEAFMDEPHDSGLFFSSLVHQQTKPDLLATGGHRQSRREPRETEWHRRQERQAFTLPPLQDAERVFRHGGWHQDRQRVFDALQATAAPLGRQERFANCGCDCVIEYSPTLQKHRVRASYCGDRFCLPCSRNRAMKVQANLVEWCRGERVRFVTLTLRPISDSLSDCLNHLLQSFTRLREAKAWSDKVTAGAYTIEITRGKAGSHWHVHLHALVIGSYIDQADLSEAWQRASRGSRIVDVREVKDHDRGVYYVAKYAAKGFSQSVVLNHDWLSECVCALRGRRLLGTFGEWRNRRLEDRREDADDWRTVGRFVTVHAAALRGEEWACGTFRSLGVAAGLFNDTPISVGPDDGG
jgi:Replication protein